MLLLLFLITAVPMHVVPRVRACSEGPSELFSSSCRMLESLLEAGDAVVVLEAGEPGVSLSSRTVLWEETFGALVSKGFSKCPRLPWDRLPPQAWHTAVFWFNFDLHVAGLACLYLIS